MSYRNDKRKAAIWILEQITVPAKMNIAGMSDPLSNKSIKTTKKRYDVFAFTDLLSKSKYSKDVLRSAVDLLYNNAHIKYIQESETDIYDFSMQAFPAADEALKEEIYENEISTYKNDYYYSYSRWILPIAAILISLLSIYLTTCKKEPDNTIQIEHIAQRMPQLDSIQQEILRQMRLNQPLSNVDTPSKASN